MSTVPLPDPTPPGEPLTKTAQLPASAIPVAGAAGPQLTHWVGRRIGPYRIQKLLGRGGMGAVFLAGRDDREFRKSVALKVLHFDTGDPDTLARFRNERQILATWTTPILRHSTTAGPPTTASLTSLWSTWSASR